MHGDAASEGDATLQAGGGNPAGLGGLETRTSSTAEPTLDELFFALQETKDMLKMDPQNTVRSCLSLVILEGKGGIPL